MFTSFVTFEELVDARLNFIKSLIHFGFEPIDTFFNGLQESRDLSNVFISKCHTAFVPETKIGVKVAVDNVANQSSRKRVPPSFVGKLMNSGGWLVRRPSLARYVAVIETVISVSVTRQISTDSTGFFFPYRVLLNPNTVSPAYSLLSSSNKSRMRGMYHRSFELSRVIRKINRFVFLSVEIGARLSGVLAQERARKAHALPYFASSSPKSTSTSAISPFAMDSRNMIARTVIRRFKTSHLWALQNRPF